MLGGCSKTLASLGAAGFLDHNSGLFQLEINVPSSPQCVVILHMGTRSKFRTPQVCCGYLPQQGGVRKGTEQVSAMLADDAGDFFSHNGNMRVREKYESLGQTVMFYPEETS